MGKAKDVAGDMADYSGRIGSLLDSVEDIMTEAQRSNARSHYDQIKTLKGSPFQRWLKTRYLYS